MKIEKQNDNKRESMGREKESVIFPVPTKQCDLPAEYNPFIKQIKDAIAQQRIKTIHTANVSMIMLYWQIGSAILERQSSAGWGAKIIDRMSYDLKTAFPDMKGFSPRNLKYMRKFAEAWPDKKLVQRTVAQIPWRSNITLLDKLQDSEMRLWYAQQTLQNGFGKDMLVFQIETQLHKRVGNTVNNFKVSLPNLDSDFVSQMFKDPYMFDFLGTADPRRESELEQKLIDHLQKFLLELGQGFAFVGRQVHLELGNNDFYLDLLFYHIKLRCYVVVELKSGDFKPGYISKLNMYLNVVNDLLQQPEDKPSIGLLLVKAKNKMLVEYSLAGYSNPIGVADWQRQIKETWPEDLKTSLPTIEEIEMELTN